MCRTCQRSWDPTHDRCLDTDGKFKEQGANAQNEEEKD